MAKRVVTLYIDETSLRLLVVEGKKVVKWADLPLEAGLVNDGIIVEQAQVAAKIKELLEKEKVSAVKVVAGLSGLHCVSRLVKLPHLPKSMLDEAVGREAERVMSVPMEQLYLSWQPIVDSGAEMDVFLLAFPRSAADALVQTLRSVALEPYLIDLKPLALTRVADRPTAIIADIQPTDVDIVVMVDRVPQLIRTLSLPSEAGSWQEKLPILKEELDRTAKFYNSSHADNPLDSDVPVFVSGELAQESEVCESLASELKYSVLPLPSPLECPDGLPAGRCMVNIGLALKEVAVPRAKANFSVVDLNVLPDVYRPKARSLTPFLTVLGVIAAAGVLAFLGMLFQDVASDVAALRAELYATNQLLIERQSQWQAQMNSITELEGRVAEVEASSRTFDTATQRFAEGRTEVNGNLNVALYTLPSGVELTSVSRGDTGMTIGGVASTEAEVLAYAKELRDSRWFSSVIISRMGLVGDAVTFVFTLTN